MQTQNASSPLVPSPPKSCNLTTASVNGRPTHLRLNDIQGRLSAVMTLGIITTLNFYFGGILALKWGS